MTSVVLRDLEVGYVSWIFDACQDREIQRWTLVPRPYTRAHASEFVTAPAAEFARWVLESISSGEPVGVISIHAIESGRASIGYWMSAQHRGRGYMVEAIGLVRDDIERRHAAGEIEVETMVALIARDNAASRTVIERAGFALASVQHGPAVDDLVVVDTCVYESALRPSL